MTRTVGGKLLTETVLFALALLLMASRLTGLVIHEWLGVVVVLPLIVHLLLSWAWLRTAIRRFLGHLPGEMRINAILDAAFFVTMTGTIFSGLLVSEVVLPTFRLVPGHDPTLRWLHSFSADAMLVVLGLHLGMKWRWIRRILGNLLRPERTRPTDRLTPAPATQRAPTARVVADQAACGRLAAVPVPRANARRPVPVGRCPR